MTGALIRRDPAVLTALKILPFALLHGYTMRVSAHAAPLWLSVGVTWAMVVALLAFSSAHQRCGEFAMGLPIAARKLWLLRTGVLAGASVLLIAVVAAMVQAWLYVSLGACVLLAVVWMQSWAPQKNVLSGFGFWLWAKAGVAGAIGLSVWLAPASAWMALAPLGAALALSVRTYLAVPAGFEMSLSAAARPAEGRPYLVGWLLVPRSLYEWYWWLIFVVFFLVGLMPDSEEGLPVMVLALGVPLIAVVFKLPQMAYLPISRRRLFAWGTLPAVISYFGGLTAGWMVRGFHGFGSYLLMYEPGGPETLRFVQLRVDVSVAAVLAVMGGLLWLALVLLQVYRQSVPALTRRAGRLLRLRWVGLIAVFALAWPVMAVLLTEESSLFGKPGEALGYYFALTVARAAGVFPSPWLSVVVAVAALGGIYLWAERRFMRAEALTPRGGLL